MGSTRVTLKEGNDFIPGMELFDLDPRLPTRGTKIFSFIIYFSRYLRGEGYRWIC